MISIKQNGSPDLGSSLSDSIPGSFGAKNYALVWMIEYAYDIKQVSRIEGLPAWANSERYDVTAKADDASAAQEKALSYDERVKLTEARVQSLLAARFGLQLHHETKSMPVLALMAAKGGPKLTEATLAPAKGDPYPLPPGSARAGMSGGEWIVESNQRALSTLIQILGGQPEASGRILVDRTGLAGKYSFRLEWQAQNLSGGAAASSEAPGPSLFTALEEQLGLRLESTKAPVDVLVIDHVEKPSPN